MTDITASSSLLRRRVLARYYVLLSGLVLAPLWPCPRPSTAASSPLRYRVLALHACVLLALYALYALYARVRGPPCCKVSLSRNTFFPPRPPRPRLRSAMS
jgi:hypothetical protein